MGNFLLFRRSWLLSIFILFPAFCFAQVAREWVAIFNGPGNGEDIARSVAVDVLGNVYVTGQSQGAGTGLDYATIKYDAAGVQLWSVRYNGPGNGEDAAKALVIDDAGNVYVTGRSIGIGTNFDFATIKYDNNGNFIWERRFNSLINGFDEATAIDLDKDGNVYVTGFGATIKYDNNGVLKWVFTHSVNSQSLALDKDGNAYITGYSFSSFSSFDYATMKFNTNGIQLWFKIYHANNSDIAADLALDRNGNVYVTGQSDGIGTSKDIATVKYDTDGNEQWVARYNNSPVNGWDEAFAITTDDKGYVYVTGQSDGNGSAEDYVTLKYKSKGALQWVARYNGPDNVFDRALAIGVDNKANVYITGFSTATAIGHDIATIKYNKKGKEQWVERFNGTANGNDGAFSLALDASGNVYITGQAAGSGTGFDYITLRYSQFRHGRIETNPTPSITTVSERKKQPSLSHNELPGRFKASIIPNPAASTTKIFYELPVDGHVFIKVYDVLGRGITTLVDAGRKAGYYSMEFNVSAIKNGLYFYSITVKTKNNVWVQTSKISIVK